MIKNFKSTRKLLSNFNCNAVKDIKIALGFILYVLTPYKWLILAKGIIGLIWAIDLSLRPYLLKVILDTILSISYLTKAYSDLLYPTCCYIFMSAFVVIISYLYSYLQININPLLKKDIGQKLVSKLLMNFQISFQQYSSGSLGNKINDAMSGIPNLLDILMDSLFCYLLSLLIAFVTLLQLNIVLGIALTIWSIFFLLISLIFSAKIKTSSFVASEVNSNIIGNIVDVIGNILSVKVFNGQYTEQKKLAKLLDKSVKADQKRDWLFIKLYIFQGGTFLIYQSFTLLFLIASFKEDNISIGDIALALTINVSIVNALGSLSRDINKSAELIGNVIQSLNFVLNFTSNCTDLNISQLSGSASFLKKNEEMDFTQIKSEVKSYDINFNSVVFWYNKKKPLFRSLNVTIKNGEKIGIVGYSGSGKSTFIHLIMRLLFVKGGSITIAGKNILDLSQDYLHSIISMIPQNTTLFNRTIIENISYAKQNTSYQELLEASKKACAHEFIQNLQDDYYSYVGEKGKKLSGGELQRILLARAFLRNTPIIILDEVTSQLDSLTENKIQYSIDQLLKDKTALVVSHKLSTLLKMDRILVFDQGEIVEDGSHQQLLKTKGLYSKLWDTQIAGFLPQDFSIKKYSL
ncbi:ABC transporter permease (plasmid) [Candidatus Megaera polyxenophila]|nr:ABC transporter permease [Candidatus Megaera polyxenophila]